MQSVEPGLYVHNDSLVQQGGHSETEFEAVNLAESTQQTQQQLETKDTCTSVDIEKEKDMVDHSVTVTAEELQSVESLLKLAPPAYEEQPDVVDKTIKVHKGRNPATTLKVHKGRNPTIKRKPEPKPSDEQAKQNPRTNDKGDQTKVEAKGLNEILFETIKSAKIQNEKRYADPGGAFCSPYCDKVVTLSEPILDCSYTTFDCSSLFYKSKTAVGAYKIVFESFYTNQYVASNGIDAFVDVLNPEERKRDFITI
ncbi:uncharacterized protein LOC110896461 [Helianthus annuus]|uniref:uncharacterized protein LOC110896461 n=1 Tax=Helianthus annuus TaxID=4232 RepID=UPI000B8FC4F3|nr:uncharacterized protein LOC110896461 [Helianthus annuus]